MKQRLDKHFLLNRAFVGTLLAIAVPIALQNMISFGVAVMDSVMLGSFGDVAIAAANLGGQPFSILMSFGFGLSSGGSVLIAQYWGKGELRAIERVEGIALRFSILISLLFAIPAVGVPQLMMKVFTNDAELIELGASYLRIISVSYLCWSISEIYLAVLRSIERVRTSTALNVTALLLNIFLNAVFVYGWFGAPKLGVSGAAVATVFGQICAASLACFFNKKKNDDIVINPKKYHLQAHAVKSIYAIGVPSICMASIGSIMTFGMNKILIGFTSTAAAVFGVYFKLQSFIFMPVFGLNNGMVPIIGFNYGARKPDRLMKTMRLAVTYAVSIMIIGMILFWTFTPQLLAIFNASAQMLSIGVPALRIISLSFLLAGFDIIIISVMQALGHGVISLIISILRQLAVLLPVAFIFSKIWGLNAVWIAFPLAECVALVVTILFWRKVYRNEIQPLYNAER